MKLLCKRTNCSTSLIKDEVHTATLVYHAGHLNSWWIKLDPGVTGYESASVNDLLRERQRADGWSACGGTPGSWDSLRVPESEFVRLTDSLRLLAPVLDLLSARAASVPCNTDAKNSEPVIGGKI